MALSRNTWTGVVSKAANWSRSYLEIDYFGSRDWYLGIFYWIASFSAAREVVSLMNVSFRVQLYAIPV